MGGFYYMVEIPNNEEFNKTLMGKFFACFPEFPMIKKERENHTLILQGHSRQSG